MYGHRRLLDRAHEAPAARTAGEVEETAGLCPGGRCVPHSADVSRPGEVGQLVDRCLAEFGRLDVLVNNAGVAPWSKAAEMSDDEFARVMAVNVHAVFYTCRRAWPALLESRGTIINISSLAAHDPFPGLAVYGATKAWVNTFSRALAEEGRPHGVKVFALGPGAVETVMLRTGLPDFPPEKTMDPDHVAGVVEWLLDDRCRFATGQTIYIRR
ncbi:MAG: SDR family oxidoreductase [Phycisphaerae bacterium]